MLALFSPVILKPYKSIGQHILYDEMDNKHVLAVPKLCGLDHSSGVQYQDFYFDTIMG